MTCAACCVGFVGVNVHGGRVAGADSDDNVAEGGGSVGGLDLDGDNLAVLYAEFLSVFGGEVDVSLGSDNAFLKSNFACGSFDDAAGSACKVA